MTNTKPLTASGFARVPLTISEFTDRVMDLVLDGLLDVDEAKALLARKRGIGREWIADLALLANESANNE